MLSSVFPDTVLYLGIEIKIIHMPFQHWVSQITSEYMQSLILFIEIKKKLKVSKLFGMIRNYPQTE